VISIVVKKIFLFTHLLIRDPIVGLAKVLLKPPDLCSHNAKHELFQILGGEEDVRTKIEK
jgi:hypothetical protein